MPLFRDDITQPADDSSTTISGRASTTTRSRRSVVSDELPYGEREHASSSGDLEDQATSSVHQERTHNDGVYNRSNEGGFQPVVSWIQQSPSDMHSTKSEDDISSSNIDNTMIKEQLQQTLIFHLLLLCFPFKERFSDECTQSLMSSMYYCSGPYFMLCLLFTCCWLLKDIMISSLRQLHAIFYLFGVYFQVTHLIILYAQGIVEEQNKMLAILLVCAAKALSFRQALAAYMAFLKCDQKLLTARFLGSLCYVPTILFASYPLCYLIDDKSYLLWYVTAVYNVFINHHALFFVYPLLVYCACLVELLWTNPTRALIFWQKIQNLVLANEDRLPCDKCFLVNLILFVVCFIFDYLFALIFVLR